MAKYPPRPLLQDSCTFTTIYLEDSSAFFDLTQEIPSWVSMEINDDVTRAMVRCLIKDRLGLLNEPFDLVCSEENNSSFIIDSGWLYADVFFRGTWLTYQLGADMNDWKNMRGEYLFENKHD